MSSYSRWLQEQSDARRGRTGGHREQNPAVEAIDDTLSDMSEGVGRAVADTPKTLLNLGVGGFLAGFSLVTFGPAARRMFGSRRR